MSALEQPETRVGVAVILRRADGAILFGLRQGGHGAGSWALPGGKPLPRETMIDAAARELGEEAGLVANNLRSLNIWTHNIFEGELPDYITLWFVGDAQEDAEARVLEPEKCGGWMWGQPGDVPAPYFGCLQTFIDQGHDPWTAARQAPVMAIPMTPNEVLALCLAKRDCDAELVRLRGLDAAARHVVRCIQSGSPFTVKGALRSLGNMLFPGDPALERFAAMVNTYFKPQAELEIPADHREAMRSFLGYLQETDALEEVAETLRAKIDAGDATKADQERLLGVLDEMQGVLARQTEWLGGAGLLAELGRSQIALLRKLDKARLAPTRKG